MLKVYDASNHRTDIGLIDEVWRNCRRHPCSDRQQQRNSKFHQIRVSMQSGLFEYTRVAWYFLAVRRTPTGGLRVGSTIGTV